MKSQYILLAMLATAALTMGCASQNDGSQQQAELEGVSSEAKDQLGLLECGGFAGIQCPDGFTCIDNPLDNCDPNQGGADCGGLCVPEIGVPCNKDICGVGEFCCNESCSICAPLNGGCTKQYCGPVDPPGTTCGPHVCAPGTVGCNCACGNAACVPEGLSCPAVCL